MKFPLIGPSNTAYSLAAAAQQSMNCYVESIEAGGDKNKFVLRGIPGIHLFKDLTAISASGLSIDEYLDREEEDEDAKKSARTK